MGARREGWNSGGLARWGAVCLHGHVRSRGIVIWLFPGRCSLLARGRRKWEKPSRFRKVDDGEWTGGRGCWWCPRAVTEEGPCWAARRPGPSLPGPCSERHPGFSLRGHTDPQRFLLLSAPELGAHAAGSEDAPGPLCPSGLHSTLARPLSGPAVMGAWSETQPRTDHGCCLLGFRMGGASRALPGPPGSRGGRSLLCPPCGFTWCPSWGPPPTSASHRSRSLCPEERGTLPQPATHSAFAVAPGTHVTLMADAEAAVTWSDRPSSRWHLCAKGRTRPRAGDLPSTNHHASPGCPQVPTGFTHGSVWFLIEGWWMTSVVLVSGVQCSGSVTCICSFSDPFPL